MTDKIIDKIKALHDKAESAKQLGSEAEAQSFAAKVQELLLKYKLTMSEVEYSKRDQNDQIESLWIDFSANGLDAKRCRVAWTEHLCAVIVRAYCCKMAVGTGTNTLMIIGRSSERAVAEFMFVTLARFLKKLANQEQVKFYYDCKARGNLEEAKGFKTAFLIGFIKRLSERFDEELRKIKEEEQRLAKTAGTECTSLMRIERSLVEINSYIKENPSFGRAPGIGGRSSTCEEGNRRGRQAADSVNLNPNAVEGSSNSSKLLL